jgi:hypothetical protein
MVATVGLIASGLAWSRAGNTIRSMGKVTEYKTVSADSAAQLDTAVNELLHRGFQLFGNPYLANASASAEAAETKEALQIFQAMIRCSLGT